MIMIMGVRVAERIFFSPFVDTDDGFLWGLDLEFEKPRINKDIFFLVITACTDKCSYSKSCTMAKSLFHSWQTDMPYFSTTESILSLSSSSRNPCHPRWTTSGA